MNWCKAMENMREGEPNGSSGLAYEGKGSGVRITAGVPSFQSFSATTILQNHTDCATTETDRVGLRAPPDKAPCSKILVLSCQPCCPI